MPCTQTKQHKEKTTQEAIEIRPSLYTNKLEESVADKQKKTTENIKETLPEKLQQ